MELDLISHGKMIRKMGKVKDLIPMEKIKCIFLMVLSLKSKEAIVYHRMVKDRKET